MFIINSSRDDKAISEKDAVVA